MNGDWRSGLKKTHRRIMKRKIRRRICIEPKGIQRAPANRVRILVLGKRFAAPGNGLECLSANPRLAAVALVVQRAVV